jgi:phosphatidylserine/phosphatidylglycerophosphate/cardiolipin synthase-like enzyme
VKKVFLALAFALALNLAAQTDGILPVPAGSSYEVGFSPSGTAGDLVVKAIQSAKKTIHVAAYGMTSKEVADALIAAAKRGVKVQVMADSGAAKSQYSMVKSLQAAGIAVRMDKKYAIMHNKFMVIDGLSVQTGSYNYTKNADKSNAENVLVVWNAKSIAEVYLKEWNRLWDEAR